MNRGLGRLRGVRGIGGIRGRRRELALVKDVKEGEVCDDGE